jgi:hypothetical protein
MRKAVIWFDALVERFATENLRSRIKVVKWLSLGSLILLLIGGAFFYQKDISIDYRTIAVISTSDEAEAFAFVSLPSEFEGALRGAEGIFLRFGEQWHRSKISEEKFEEGVMLVLDNEKEIWTEGQRVELILRLPNIRLGEMFFRKQENREEITSPSP